MDSWGIGILVLGVLIFAFTVKNYKGWAIFGGFVAGIGAGLIIGAVWAMSIVNRAIDGMF